MSSNLVVNHQHCLVCGKAMSFDPDEKTCSDKCKASLQERVKKQKRNMMFFFALAAVAMVLSLYYSVPR